MTGPLALHAGLVAGRLTAAPTTAATGCASLLREARAGLVTDVHALGGCWSGRGATAADRALRGRVAGLEDLAGDLRRAAGVLAGVAAAQETVRDAATRALLLWWDAVRAGHPGLLRAVEAVVVGVLQQLRAGLVAELARAAAALDALAAAPTPTGPARAVSAAPVPGASTAPQQVAQWWAGLPGARQTHLQATAPDALAGLRGLPPTVADRVNRARLQRDLTAAGHAVEAARTALAGTPLVDVPARLHATARVQDASVHAARVRDTATAVRDAGPALLLAYSPQPGRGLALAHGDPSTASRLAVVVPGVGSGPARPQLEQARALRAAMDAHDPSGRHAVVQWLDQQAPSGLTDPRVLTDDLARAAAPRLVADVDGYRAAHEQRHQDVGLPGPPQQVTVLGHSYGSTVVGLAGAGGLAADDLVSLGSPGMGVASAADLPGRVWVGTAEHDPVSQLTAGSYFSPGGTSAPTDPGFGARVLDVPDPAALLGAHSTYVEPGSVAVANLAAIATGDPGAVVTGTAAGSDARADALARASLERTWTAAQELDGPAAVLAGREAAAVLGSQVLDEVLTRAGTVGELVRAGS